MSRGPQSHTPPFGSKHASHVLAFGMLGNAIIRKAHAALTQADGGLPLVGHALAFREDALRLLTERAGTVPMGSMRLMGRTINLVGSPKVAEHVMRSGAKHFSRKTPVYHLLGLFLGQGTLVSEGETWRKHRRVIQPAFHKRRLEALTGQVAEVIDAHIRTWTGEFDARDAMMHLTLELASSILVGARTKRDAERLGEAVDASQAFVQSRLPFPWLAGFSALNRRMMDPARKTLDEIAFRLIRERREELEREPEVVHNDALGMLIEARYEDGSPLPDQQIRDEMMTLLVAGHETTSNAISWTLWYLANHPAVRREMEAEIDGVLGDRLPTFADVNALPFTRAVLDESLRLRPPVWLTGRICTKSHDFDGIHFEEGQLVLISPWVVHHRADVYENPEAFDPSRWARIRSELPPMAFFPFGGGARKCVGEAFAYLEAILTLAMISQRMRLELAPGNVVPLPQITLGFAEGLQMKVVPRVPEIT